MDAANGDGAQEIAVVQGGDLQLQGLAGITHRGWCVAKNGLKQGLQGVTVLGQIRRGEPPKTTAKEVGEITLVIISPQFQEEIQHLVHRRIRHGLGPVNFVDEDNGPQALLQSLFKDKAGLRHGAFVGIHHQQTAIHHAQHPLHLPAKVRVTRGVHDVNAGLSVVHRSVLGQDRDAPLPLQRVAVHHATGHSLPLAKNARLG